MPTWLSNAVLVICSCRFLKNSQAILRTTFFYLHFAARHSHIYLISPFQKEARGLRGEKTVMCEKKIAQGTKGMCKHYLSDNLSFLRAHKKYYLLLEIEKQQAVGFLNLGTRSVHTALTVCHLGSSSKKLTSLR